MLDERCIIENDRVLKTNNKVRIGWASIVTAGDQKIELTSLSEEEAMVTMCVWYGY